MADPKSSADKQRENKSGGAERPDLADQIGAKEERKLRARREGKKSAWFGLGMFGLVGWSVAIPTVVGIAIGIWLDRHWPSRYSWTLMFLVLGVLLGCINAWFWVKKESERRD